MASIENTSSSENKDNKVNQNSSKNIRTFRFEFSKQFIDELSRFSKVHQYDERRAYKEAWARWKSNTEITDIISVEVRRLESIGYMGDIEDKMFKSGRYYFRKKSIKQTKTNNNQNIEEMKSETENIDIDIDIEKDHHQNHEDDDDHQNQDDDDHIDYVSQDTDTTPLSSRSTKNNENATKTKQERRPYITMSKSCIRLMDDHIKSCSSQPDFKPSTSYDNFYNEKMSTPQMMDEIKVIVGKYEKTSQKTGSTSTSTAPPIPIPLETIIQEIMDKVKKTYKNRYYRFASREDQSKE